MSRCAAHTAYEGCDGRFVKASLFPARNSLRTMNRQARRRPYVRGFIALTGAFVEDPNLVHYNHLDKGGHFAACEQPGSFVQELRSGFKGLRQRPREHRF